MPVLKRAWFVDNAPGRGVVPGFGAAVGSDAAKVYAEFQLVAFQTALEYSACVGFCGASFDISNPISIGVAVAQGANGCVYSFGNGKFLGWGDPSRPEHSSGAAHAVGDWIGIAIDTPNGLSWVRNCTQAPSTWYGVSGAGTADPVAGTEGYAFVAGTGITGAIYLCAGGSQPGNANVHFPSVRLNAGTAAFAAPLPAGYFPFNSSAVFSSTDKAAELTVSEAGLLVTVSSQITAANEPTAFVRTDKYRLQ
jgi:hypothetical protein